MIRRRPRGRRPLRGREALAPESDLPAFGAPAMITTPSLLRSCRRAITLKGEYDEILHTRPCLAAPKSRAPCDCPAVDRPRRSADLAGSVD